MIFRRRQNRVRDRRRRHANPIGPVGVWCARETVAVVVWREVVEAERGAEASRCAGEKPELGERSGLIGDVAAQDRSLEDLKARIKVSK